MQYSTLKLAVALCALIPGIAAHAAIITSVSVNPSTARVGEPVTITINGDGDSPNCGIRLQFSDVIPTESFSLAERGGTLPLVLTKVFSQPGTVKIEALGRKAGPLTFGCQGEAATTISVIGANARPAPSNAQCPAGWEMMSGQKDPSKGFVCAPMRPAMRIDCGPGLSYFESDGLIGCRKRR